MDPKPCPLVPPAFQGFTKEITLDRDRWYGFIKDYDGGTLMECVLHPQASAPWGLAFW